MTATTLTIRVFLREAQRRIPCRAVAYTTPSREQLHFHTGDQHDARSTRLLLERAADNLLLECRNRSEPLARNRVRYESGGSLIGRFLASPVHDEGGAFAGILIAFRENDAPEFDRNDTRNAAVLAHQLAKAMSLPADPLTGMPTRTGLEKLALWRLAGLDEGAASSVLYGDIDQLHVINDVLGFNAGDEAIAAVARALDAQLETRDAVLSRLSGDRFTIFLPGCELKEARRIADELRDTVRATPLSIGNDVVALSICFGAAALRVGERGFEHALAAAEVACKAAKDRGRNRVAAFEDSDASIVRRMDDIVIIGQLRTALDAGRFQLFGQPIAPLLQPEETRHYEILLRMIDEQERLVLPAHFMSSATRYQLLPQIDRCVITHLLPKLKSASERPGFAPLHVSINLSGPTIGDPEFLHWLTEQLDRSGVAGEWLTFELTETAAVSNLEQAQLLMQRLGERGCRFALDDFGTGLSSLAHLKTLSFSTLKIDGSFVRDILHNERSQSLVSAVAHLATAMGMQTVAEYVETPEICMRLIDLEVQFGQGYAIGRPVPLQRILEHPMAHPTKSRQG